LLKTLATAGTMALVAHFAAASFSAIPAVVIAVVIGAAVYLLFLRLSRILDHRDRERLFGLVRRVPMLQAGISWIIPAVEANA
jgi:hypothetical protein